MCPVFLYTHPLFSYLSGVKNMPASKVSLRRVLFKIDKLLAKNALTKKEYNRLIRQMIKNIKTFIKKGEKPKTIFIKIAEYLIQYENFIPTGLESSWDVYLFTSLLKNRKGSCVPFSLLYLIISEYLKLPVYASISPEHIFIKFDSPEEKFNVETVYFEYRQVIYEPGAFITDKMYKKSFNIPRRAIKKGFFLQTLNRKEVIGIYLNNLGALTLYDALVETNYEKFKTKAILGKNLLLFSIKFYYNNFSALLNLASFYTLWLPDKDKAKKFLLMAKKILHNKKTKIATGEFLIKTKNPLFINYIDRVSLDSITKQVLNSKFYLVTGDFKQTASYSLKLLQNYPQNQEYVSYYLYSLIKLNQFDEAYVVLENFKKAYATTITPLIFTVEGIFNIYRYKETTDQNDIISRITNYISSINWHNPLNKHIFEEYYYFLKDNKNIATLLKKYLVE